MKNTLKTKHTSRTKIIPIFACLAAFILMVEPARADAAIQTLTWTNGYNYDSIVIQQAPGSNGTAFVNLTSLAGSPTTTIVSNLTVNTWYTYRVAGTLGALTSQWSNVAWNRTKFPPQITTQPLSATVYLGQPAVLSVAATGTTPLAYQWRKGGMAVTGATNATLTIAAVAVADAGNYDCVVSNADGTVTSAIAVITPVLPATGALQVR